jgi:signal-transduction protein with cAMP-binding, CBS, and nucleotidyltransferase domain
VGDARADLVSAAEAAAEEAEERACRLAAENEQLMELSNALRAERDRLATQVLALGMQSHRQPHMSFMF